MYYYVEPEVAGGLGDNAVIDTSILPPAVSVLEYKFEGWLGDHLLECFPCFIVSESVAEALKELQLSGFDLDAVTVTTSDEFKEMFPSVVLPTFLWLKVFGVAGSSDFGIAIDNRLVLSEAAVRVIARFSLKNADLEEFA